MPYKDPEKRRLAARRTYAKNKEGVLKRARAAYAEDIDKSRAYNRSKAAARRAKTPPKKRTKLTAHELKYRARDRALTRMYGIGCLEFDAMAIDQLGLCYLCRKQGGKKGIGVDHSHRTGAVRRLLCGNCNLGLGNFKDDPGVLSLAAGYVLMYH